MAVAATLAWLLAYPLYHLALALVKQAGPLRALGVLAVATAIIAAAATLAALAATGLGACRINLSNSAVSERFADRRARFSPCLWYGRDRYLWGS